MYDPLLEAAASKPVHVPGKWFKTPVSSALKIPEGPVVVVSRGPEDSLFPVECPWRYWTKNSSYILRKVLEPPEIPEKPSPQKTAKSLYIYRCGCRYCRSFSFPNNGRWPDSDHPEDGQRWKVKYVETKRPEFYDPYRCSYARTDSWPETAVTLSEGTRTVPAQSVSGGPTIGKYSSREKVTYNILLAVVLSFLYRTSPDDQWWIPRAGCTWYGLLWTFVNFPVLALFSYHIAQLSRLSTPLYHQNPICRRETWSAFSPLCEYIEESRAAYLPYTPKFLDQDTFIPLAVASYITGAWNLYLFTSIVCYNDYHLQAGYDLELNDGWRSRRKRTGPTPFWSGIFLGIQLVIASRVVVTIISKCTWSWLTVSGLDPGPFAWLWFLCIGCHFFENPGPIVKMPVETSVPNVVWVMCTTAVLLCVCLLQFWDNNLDLAWVGRGGPIWVFCLAFFSLYTNIHLLTMQKWEFNEKIEQVKTDSQLRIVHDIAKFQEAQDSKFSQFRQELKDETQRIRVDLEKLQRQVSINFYLQRTDIGHLKQGCMANRSNVFGMARQWNFMLTNDAYNYLEQIHKGTKQPDPYKFQMDTEIQDYDWKPLWKSNRCWHYNSGGQSSYSSQYWQQNKGPATEASPVPTASSGTPSPSITVPPEVGSSSSSPDSTRAQLGTPTLSSGTPTIESAKPFRAINSCGQIPEGTADGFVAASEKAPKSSSKPSDRLVRTSEGDPEPSSSLRKQLPARERRAQESSAEATDYTKLNVGKQEADRVRNKEEPGSLAEAAYWRHKNWVRLSEKSEGYRQLRLELEKEKSASQTQSKSEQTNSPPLPTCPPKP